jgi:hypothetical protein
MVLVLPVFLGAGTRLFEHPGGKTVPPEQLDVTPADQINNLRYRVIA